MSGFFQEIKHYYQLSLINLYNFRLIHIDNRSKNLNDLIIQMVTLNEKHLTILK